MARDVYAELRRRPAFAWLTLGAVVTALILAGTVAPAPAAAQGLEPSGDFNKGGRTAFQFLKIGMGARQAALGEAAMATVRDANSVYWNPANISGISSFQTSFSYVRWIADMNYVSGVAGVRWNRVGVFALNVASLDYGTIEEALVTGGTAGDTRTGNSVSGGDVLMGLTYAREFTDRLAIGIGLKYVHETLFEYSVGTFAFDVGTSYDMGYKGIRLAMSAQNFGGGSVNWLEEGMRDRTVGYDIPFIFRIGVSTAVVGGQDAFVDVGDTHELVLSAEAVNSNDYSERIHLGAEYAFTNLVTLRGGYRFNYEEGKWSLGVGLNPRLAGLKLSIDYAYVAYEFLDAPHRFSVTLGR